MEKQQIKADTRALLACIERDLGVNPTTLANYIGVSQSTINRSANDPDYSVISTKTLGLINTWLTKVAQDLDLTEDEGRTDEARERTSQLLQMVIDYSTSQKLKNKPSTQIASFATSGAPIYKKSGRDKVLQALNKVRATAPQAPQRARALPVYGTAAGSLSGSMQLEEGWQLDHVNCPPALRNNEKAYALVVTGNSMSPKYENGDLVFVDPTARIDVGDTIIIQTKNFNPHVDEPTQAYIKTYRGVVDNKLFAEQFNPPAKLDFVMRSDKDGTEVVYAYHKVLTMRELFIMQ